MERRLVEQARAGDQGAYEHLARSMARRLFLIAHRILRDSDAAEDATQHTLVTIWRELPRLRDPDRFEAWSYRILTRAALAEARRQRHADVTELDPGVHAAPDTASAVAVRDALERAFRRLSPDHRAVIVLRFYADLPIATIADALGVPSGTVASRLHRAIRDLRHILAADGGERVPAAWGEEDRTLATNGGRT